MEFSLYFRSLISKNSLISIRIPIFLKCKGNEHGCVHESARRGGDHHAGVNVHSHDLCWKMVFIVYQTHKKEGEGTLQKCLVSRFWLLNVKHCSDFNIYILLSIILGIVFLDGGKMSSHQTTHLNLWLDWTDSRDGVVRTKLFKYQTWNMATLHFSVKVLNELWGKLFVYLLLFHHLPKPRLPIP